MAVKEMANNIWQLPSTLEHHGNKFSFQSAGFSRWLCGGEGVEQVRLAPIWPVSTLSIVYGSSS